MNPELFTLVMRADGAQPVIVTGASAGDAVAYALGARGAETISIHPMHYRDKEGDPDAVENRSKRCVLCEVRPQGGLQATYVSTTDRYIPRWAEIFIRRVDTGLFEQRRAAAEQRKRHALFGLEQRARVVA